MAIDLDYTKVDISDDGATFGTAIRTQFQNAQSDLGKRPEKNGSELILGNWTFELGNVTFMDGFTSNNGFTSNGLADFSFGQVDVRTRMFFKDSGAMQFNNNPTHDGNCSFGGEIGFKGGVDLHAPGTSGDVTVAEITMDEIVSGNSNPNGVKITKRDGGRFVDIVIFSDGVEKTGSELSIDTLSGNFNFGDDAILKIGRFRLTATAPLTSSSNGFKYEIATDLNYIYVCVNNNTWKRVALSTW